jgi:ADP-heptose:LPS heptosyltransferase
VAPHPREEPWLTVPRPRRAARVLLHRSARYHKWAFPWPRAYEKYRREAAVVGTPEEHRDFCAYLGPLPYIPTPTFLDLAEVIAGCELFVGNQSAPRAVALGLGKLLVGRHN